MKTCRQVFFRDAAGSPERTTVFPRSRGLDENDFSKNVKKKKHAVIAIIRLNALRNRTSAVNTNRGKNKNGLVFDIGFLILSFYLSEDRDIHPDRPRERPHRRRL